MKKVFITPVIIQEVQEHGITQVALQHGWTRSALSKALKRHKRNVEAVFFPPEAKAVIAQPQSTSPAKPGKNCRVLIIGDRHSPFTHKKYFDFIRQTRDEFQCDTIVDIGDMLDGHSWSYHEHNPNGMSAGHELDAARKDHEKWFKEFPNAFCCYGNHDELIMRKARTHGLPQDLFHQIKDVLMAPSGWHWAFKWEIDGVCYMHGTGKSGQNAHVQWATANRQSTVIGHAHSGLGVNYMASEKDLIFGMNVGTGMNIKTYAAEYGKDFSKRPTLGCGVVIGGKLAIAIPMDLGAKVLWIA